MEKTLKIQRVQRRIRETEISARICLVAGIIGATVGLFLCYYAIIAYYQQEPGRWLVLAGVILAGGANFFIMRSAKLHRKIERAERWLEEHQ